MWLHYISRENSSSNKPTLGFHKFFRWKLSYLRFLRYVNTHAYKDKKKFEDSKYFEHYSEGEEGYLFKFELKNEYQHIDIFQAHQNFFGFYWVIKGKIRFFVVTVLPFGLTNKPFIFINIFRTLVKYWRFSSIKITCFFVDGIGIEYNYKEAKNLFKNLFKKLSKIRFYTHQWKIYMGTWNDNSSMMGTMQNIYLVRERYKPFMRYIENHQVSHW